MVKNTKHPRLGFLQSKKLQSTDPIRGLEACFLHINETHIMNVLYEHFIYDIVKTPDGALAPVGVQPAVNGTFDINSLNKFISTVKGFGPLILYQGYKIGAQP